MTEHILPIGRLFFLYVKTHEHLEYFLKLRDTRRAANQDRLRTAKVIEIRAVDAAAVNESARRNV